MNRSLSGSSAVLMVAFHFPPMVGSSGQMRSVSFANGLFASGWRVHVLTASSCAHPRVSQSTLSNLSAGIRVYPALALDAARHLSIRGRYPGFLELPDRWSTWIIGGIAKGLSIVRRERPAAIWSTYPIATTQIIALALAKLTSLPLVADLRDPMVDAEYPRDKRRRIVHQRIEQGVIRESRLVTFTAPGTKAMYIRKYGIEAAEKFAVIENGFEEDVFRRASQRARSESRGHKTTIVHSGSLYPKERNPAPFFEAVAELSKQSPTVLDRVQIVLRGTGHDQLYAPLLRKLGIDHVVVLKPPNGHVDAVAEMLTSDGLLLFQAASCDHQIPAKVYEYLRSGRPIFGLVGPHGDTAALLRGFDRTVLTSLDDVAQIRDALAAFLRRTREGGFGDNGPDTSVFERRQRAQDLHRFLSDVAHTSQRDVLGGGAKL